MQELFTALSRAVEGAPLVALAASFAWGILSILLSPCHLASIPLVVGFIGGQGAVSARRAFVISLLFALGILMTIGTVGAVTAAAGRMLGDLGAWSNYAVAAVLFLVGLYLLDVIPVSWSGTGLSSAKGSGPLAALALGLIFGIAVGPCTFAYMIPVLTITFRAAAHNPLYAVLLLLAYGIGHCSVIVLAGTSTQLVQRYLNWSERSSGTVILRRVCGVLVLIAGLYMIYIAP